MCLSFNKTDLERVLLWFTILKILYKLYQTNINNDTDKF